MTLIIFKEIFSTSWIRLKVGKWAADVTNMFFDTRAKQIGTFFRIRIRPDPLQTSMPAKGFVRTLFV